MKEKDLDLNIPDGAEEITDAVEENTTAVATEELSDAGEAAVEAAADAAEDSAVEAVQTVEAVDAVVEDGKSAKKVKKGKKGAKIALKIANIIINVLIVCVLIVSILIATLALTSKANDGVPSIFGYSFHTIMSDSMKGGSDKYSGGDFERGDLVIGKATKGNPNEVYEVGDIVVYTEKDDSTPDGVKFIAHRVIEVHPREYVSDGNGKYEYVTKGDNNADPDDKLVTASDIVAVCYDSDYHGKVLKGFGNFMNYIRSSNGFFLIVLLPMIIFFLYAIVRVVLNTLVYKKSKTEDEKEIAEREKQEAVDAAVKAALAAVGKNDEASADAAPAEDAKPAETAPAEMTPEEYEEFKRFMAFKKAQKDEKPEE